MGHVNEVTLKYYAKATLKNLINYSTLPSINLQSSRASVGSHRNVHLQSSVSDEEKEKVLRWLHLRNNNNFYNESEMQRVWIVLASDWYERKMKGEMNGWRTKSNRWQKSRAANELARRNFY